MIRAIDLANTDGTRKQSASVRAVQRDKLSGLCQTCDLLGPKPHTVNICCDLLLTDDDRIFQYFICHLKLL